MNLLNLSNLLLYHFPAGHRSEAIHHFARVHPQPGCPQRPAPHRAEGFQSAHLPQIHRRRASVPRGGTRKPTRAHRARATASLLASVHAGTGKSLR
ncbi:MAG: hypothetical protein ACOYMV_11375 [Verrucomicrobiia bacterium]